MIERFEPIETARLRLDPITAEDARAIRRGAAAGLGAAEGWPQPGTMAGIALAEEHGHPPGWFIRRTGRVIGDRGIRAPVDSAGRVEIGYGLAVPSQGQGFGSEVVLAITEWLLARPDVSVVLARTLPSNIASRRVLEKAGFALVDKARDECFYERRGDGDS